MVDQKWFWCQRHLYHLAVLSVLVSVCVAGSGCSSKAKDGGFPDSRFAACRGKFYGHVKYASLLCADGWKVCDWSRDGHSLMQVSWNQALSVEGCFAYNAAQDGGQCRECRNDLVHDDLAGIGRGCPSWSKGQTSCIRGGRIDASCCVDSHVSLNRACQQQPWIDGVFCCKQTVRKPHIIVPPPDRMDVYVGEIFMLSCQSDGAPPPRVVWYKDGTKVTSDTGRVSSLPSGDLLVTLARSSDSGLYSCEVINDEGMDMAHSQVMVIEHESGCADSSSEGLSVHENIHACSGRWKGHVKQGSTLCASGWRVCNYQDTDKLKDLSWLDILEMPGCYAYDAGNNKRGKCQRCRPGKGKMAGVGMNCGRVRYSQPSCLAQGRVDVYRSRDQVTRENSCSYSEGITSGVLCCKRDKRSPSRNHRKNRVKPDEERPHCELGCENGGVCMGRNLCMCPVGYKGAMCQNAVCPDGCGRRAKCVSPGKCECIHPYTGEGCIEKKPQPGQHGCKSPCLNGGRCRRGKCKCPPTHYGTSCQHLFKHILLSHLNRTER